MSNKSSQPHREGAIAKLQAFLKTPLRLESDDELSSSFDKIYVTVPERGRKCMTIQVVTGRLTIKLLIEIRGCDSE